MRLQKLFVFVVSYTIPIFKYLACYVIQANA